MPFDKDQPYNDLPLLSNDRSLYYSEKIYEKLIKARAALAELKGSTEKLPNPEMLINTISMQEAKDSSTIENIFTTQINTIPSSVPLLNNTIEFFPLDNSQHFFNNQVVNNWSSLPFDVVNAIFINSFKNKLDKCWENRMYVT